MIRRGLVLAAPGSLLATVVLLVWHRTAFRHGPGVPTAGTEEAWAVMWLCLGLVVAGHALSLLATAEWLVRSWWHGRGVEACLWAALAYQLVVGGPLLWFVLLG